MSKPLGLSVEVEEAEDIPVFVPLPKQYVNETVKNSSEKNSSLVIALLNKYGLVIYVLGIIVFSIIAGVTKHPAAIAIPCVMAVAFPFVLLAIVNSSIIRSVDSKLKDEYSSPATQAKKLASNIAFQTKTKTARPMFVREQDKNNKIFFQYVDPKWLGSFDWLTQIKLRKNGYRPAPGPMPETWLTRFGSLVKYAFGRNDCLPDAFIKRDWTAKEYEELTPSAIYTFQNKNLTARRFEKQPTSPLSPIFKTTPITPPPPPPPPLPEPHLGVWSANHPYDK